MANLQVFFFVYLLAALATLHGSSAVEYTVTNEVPMTPGARLGFQKECSKRWPLGLFIVDNLDPRAIAVTSNDKINVSAKSMESLTGEQLKRSFNGLLYHEMAHVWQWNGNGQQGDDHLGGLIEGITDFVRLKADYVPDGRPRRGDGEHWYKGYAVTAWFLDYCEGLGGA
ncbi:uncharacterized protein LOC120186455 [Hibiscus syriacus]|uniref:uncharacterized protein LOC120186455 n=1 Tax=Hibiscus syriacus TaxID=106335 RepID=UPI001920B9D1|nr:uncharacterized protein LOC120186455 [Hibiscus syriacus]